MKITTAVLLVDNQDKALQFYVGKLGFKKKSDINMGPFRWLTVSVPEGASDMEIYFEPTDFPPAKTYQKARFDAGIPIFAFTSSDIHAEYERLTRLGVVFRSEPKNLGAILSAEFEDTCGNLIHLVQPLAS
jgi:catechol 2,3-dioxygenase-like lactoylglutathione lyase family enzyme